MKNLILIILLGCLLGGCGAEQKNKDSGMIPPEKAYTIPTEETYEKITAPTENDEIPFQVIDTEDKPWEGDYEIDIPRVPNKETALAFAEAVLVAYEYHYYTKPKHLIGIDYYEKYDVWYVSYAWEPKYPGATIEIAIKGSTGEILRIWPGE